MTLLNFIYGWFYYGFYYMLASAFVTVMLNRVTKRLWLTPFIVNGVSVAILLLAASTGWISQGNASYAMYFNYMPIVIASILINASIGVIRKIDRIIKEKLWGYEPITERGRE